FNFRISITPYSNILQNDEGSGISTTSFPSESEDLHSLVLNGLLEEMPTTANQPPTMGNKRRPSVSIDRSNPSRPSGRRSSV
ncbi:hypothetical protein PFISCL1PPCAC_29101, partial [Pristionchus fissidentatus]